MEYYYPSNGTEGVSFISTWCENCRKDTGVRGGKTYCPILDKSMICEQGAIIKQWVIDEETGQPKCTSFVDYREKRETKTSRIIKNQAKLL